MHPLTPAAALAALLLSPAGASAGEPTPPATTQAIDRLSADGMRGFHALGLTRLAIFDGRIADAKRLVGEAASAFDKASSGATVTEQAPPAPDAARPPADRAAAEAEAARLNAAKQENSAKVYAGGAPNDAAAAAFNAAAEERAASAANAAKQEASAKAYAGAAPARWVPVDAEMGLTDDFATDPKKAAAVAAADRALAAGDRESAMAALRDANVGAVSLIALVPLEQTVADTHRAATLVEGGKYYEASQLLRRVQASVRLVDAAGKP